MARELYDNAILVGLIDSFCLVCEEHLPNDGEVRSHIAESGHAANVRALQRDDKYLDDYIVKVKRGYYCVDCNAIFQTTAKLSLHLSHHSHRAKRGARLLSRDGASVVYGGLRLHPRAWNGFVENTCMVCDVEVDDEASHLLEPSHAFNLTKSTVDFGANNAIFRKIDDSTVQCITCNIVLNLRDAKHWESFEHEQILLKCKEDFNDNNIIVTLSESEGFKTAKDVNVEILDCPDDMGFSCSSETFMSADESQDNEENTLQIMESVSNFEKNEVNINFLNETARCKKCLGNIDFDYQSIKIHIDEHKRNPEKRNASYVPFQCEVNMKREDETSQSETEHNNMRLPAIAPAANIPYADKNETIYDRKTNEYKTTEDVVAMTEDEDPAEFAKRNQITFNKNNKDAYCRVCQVKMPSSLRSLREHAAGNAHTKRANAHTKRANAHSKSASRARTESKQFSVHSKCRMLDYVTDCCKIQEFCRRESVVNMKFCMETWSFNLMTKFGGRRRCQVCEVGFLRDSEAQRHCELSAHQEALLQTLVVTTYTTEFVREVRPGVFHCAFCNHLEAGESLLAAHFNSDIHKLHKALYENRLRSHLPGIMIHRRETAIRQAVFHMVLSSFL